MSYRLDPLKVLAKKLNNEMSRVATNRLGSLSISEKAKEDLVK